MLTTAKKQQTLHLDKWYLNNHYQIIEWRQEGINNVVIMNRRQLLRIGFLGYFKKFCIIVNILYLCPVGLQMFVDINDNIDHR